MRECMRRKLAAKNFLMKTWKMDLIVSRGAWWERAKINLARNFCHNSLCSCGCAVLFVHYAFEPNKRIPGIGSGKVFSILFLNWMHFGNASATCDTRPAIPHISTKRLHPESESSVNVPPMIFTQVIVIIQRVVAYAHALHSVWPCFTYWKGCGLYTW